MKLLKSMLINLIKCGSQLWFCTVKSLKSLIVSRVTNLILHAHVVISKNNASKPSFDNELPLYRREINEVVTHLIRDSDRTQIEIKA